MGWSASCKTGGKWWTSLQFRLWGEHRKQHWHQAQLKNVDKISYCGQDVLTKFFCPLIQRFIKLLLNRISAWTTDYKSCFKDERRLQWRLTKFLFIVYYRWCLNMTNIKSVKTILCLGLFVASYLSINLRILLLPLKNIKSLSTNFRAIQNLYTVD